MNQVPEPLLPPTIGPWEVLQRKEKLIGESWKFKSWLSNGLAAAGEGSYQAISRWVGNIAESMLTGVEQSISSMEFPTEKVSSLDWLSGMVKELGRRRKDMPKEDVFANLIYLISALILWGKFPLAVSGILDEKYVRQPLAAKIRPSLLDPDSVLRGWLRDMPEVKNPESHLSLLGFSSSNINVLKELAHFVPAAQDIISFAVREAYDDAYAAEFDLDQNFDKLMTEAAKDIKSAGLREETFRRFWRAHWQLPSLMQAFEMLQRRVITRENVESLMVAADIMPWWRERLVKISYRPLTRVDVRRIHKLLGKDRDWLIDRYKDLGYDEANAGVMTDFTIEYNKPRVTDRVVERELSRTDLTRLFKAGIISGKQYDVLLQDLGYDVQQILYFRMRMEAEAEEDRVNDLVKLYGKLFIEGQLSTGETVGKLTALNLRADHANFLLTKWEIQKELKRPELTKAELGRFLKKGIIETETYKTEMGKLGYREYMIEWYIADLSGVAAVD